MHACAKRPLGFKPSGTIYAIFILALLCACVPLMHDSEVVSSATPAKPSCWGSCLNRKSRVVFGLYILGDS